MRITGKKAEEHQRQMERGRMPRSSQKLAFPRAVHSSEAIYPSWPCPGLCRWLQPVLLISIQPKVTDFSNLTLLSCSFVWSCWFRSAWLLGLGCIQKALRRDLQPCLTLRPQAAQPGQCSQRAKLRGGC